MWHWNLLKLSTVGLVLLAGSAQAASGLVLEGGLHIGGERFSTVLTSNGSRDINAGELLSFGIGVGLDLAPDVESRITIGIKEDGVYAQNGDVRFTRYPIDVLLLKRLGGWKLGGGLTYHLNPEYVDTYSYPSINERFKDSLGVLVELDRDLGAVYVGGRLTLISYEEISGLYSVNGNSFGVVAGIRF